MVREMKFLSELITFNNDILPFLTKVMMRNEVISRLLRKESITEDVQTLKVKLLSSSERRQTHTAMLG